MATKLLVNDKEQFGVDRIYTNYSEITPSNILDVLEEVMPEFDKKSRFQKQLLQIVKGDTSITDGIRNANEKTRINQIKPLIMLTTAIMFNKELSLVPYKGKEEYKEDVELLVNLLRAENAHQKDMEANIMAQATGEAFIYTFSVDKPAFGNVPAKYFKIGTFESPESCAVYTKHLENIDEVVLTIHMSTFKNKVDNAEIDVKRFVCFSDKYKFIIDNENGEYKLYSKEGITNPTLHELPFNPIGYIQNDIFRQSMTEDLVGLQDTLNLALSNFNNDILIKVNQILLLIGLEVLTDAQVKRLKDEGILNIKDGDAKFITSATMLKDLIDALTIIRNIMFEQAFAPVQPKSSRAETGKAVELSAGHNLSNYVSNMREYQFFEAKRKQINNVIEILRVKNLITSDISAQDIELKLDLNRLTDFTQSLDNFIKQINNYVDPYIAASNSKCFDNPKEVAESVVVNKEKERQLQQVQTTQASNNQGSIANGNNE